MTSLPILNSRTCGGCTVCCTLPHISELNKNNYQHCKYEISGVGCGIYESRPDCCRGFKCSWLNGEIEGDERRRPDNLGMMFSVGETKEEGYCVFAWEVFKGSSNEPSVRYLIEKLVKKYRVIVIEYGGSMHTRGEKWRRIVNSPINSESVLV